MNWAERTDTFTGTNAIWTNIVTVAPALGDWTGDGNTDLLVLTEAGTVLVYTNAPPLPYSNPPFSTNLLGTPVPNAHGLSTADVNGDGVLDVLISDDNGNIWEFHGE